MNDRSESAEKVQFCLVVPAFRNLSDAECRQLVEIARERSFAPGEKVIDQGDHGAQLWILLEGKCDVVRHSDHDGPLVLAGLEPHNVFGEMSFFSPAPHSASVVAKTHVRLLSIARKDYDKLLDGGNLAAYKLAYNLTSNLATRLRRMDDWVADLVSDCDPDNGQAARVPEWSQFRKKVFENWNL